MQYQWVEDRFKLNDTNTTRIDEIQQLLVPIDQVPKKELGYYTIDLPLNYYHYKRSYTILGECSIMHYHVKESDVNVLLSDEFWKPSEEWGETIATIVGGKLRVYGDFGMDKIHLLYYRFPVEINMSDGFPDINGNATLDIGPEFTGSSLEEILTMTANYLAGITNDQFRYQTSAQLKQAHT